MSNAIGVPTNRVDGHAKVTGAARYTADVKLPGLLYGVLVNAAIPAGRVADIDTVAAESSPGLVKVFTHRNFPKLTRQKSPPLGQTVSPLQDDKIVYEGQPIAFVIATSHERAMEAARLVRAEYEGAPFNTNFPEDKSSGVSKPLFGMPADEHHGDIDGALRQAPVTVRETYATSDRHHNPMEPSATTAVWRNGELDLYDSTQGIADTRKTIAQALGLPEEKVRVHCDFIGGGFGCKGYVWPHELIVAAAAQELGRPLKLALTRAQSYTAHGYQPATKQTLTLAAGRDAKLRGVRHDVVCSGSRAGDHVEPAAWGSRTMYASPAIAVTHRSVVLDKAHPTPMRAPIEGVGMVALEIGMDELAFQLGVNPLELRLRNYAEHDPMKGKAFSSKKLRECYAEGAARFRWPSALPPPGSITDRHDRIGYGMASAIFATFRSPCAARVSIDATGQVTVASGVQEIGGGTPTVLAQVAAEGLGVPVSKVTVAIGNTDLPAGPMSAGSRITLSAGSAVQDAAAKLRSKLGDAGGATPAEYTAALARLGVSSLSADGSWTPDEKDDTPIYSFGAVFAEVAVDRDIPIPRVRRVVGVYNAGRIINPKAARSQMIGGVTWGIGQALLERSEMDHQLGRFLSKNLAGYLTPVNADVPDIDIGFIDEPDTKAGPLGARGIGELGGIGIGPAIANAVHHATGKRVREVPIRPEMLM